MSLRIRGLNFKKCPHLFNMFQMEVDFKFLSSSCFFSRYIYKFAWIFFPILIDFKSIAIINLKILIFKFVFLQDIFIKVYTYIVAIKKSSAFKKKPIQKKRLLLKAIKYPTISNYIL